MSNDEIIKSLNKLGNFNLIKYTDHYVLTIDRGMGRPMIFQSDSLEEVFKQFSNVVWIQRGSN